MTHQAKNNRLGEYVISSVGEERYRAYIPAPLPPDPPLDMTRLYPLLDQASTALGRLDGMSMILPDPSLFLYMYVRKEAVLSSQIEGTQSSLSDLLLFEVDEAPGAPSGRPACPGDLAHQAKDGHGSELRKPSEHSLAQLLKLLLRRALQQCHQLV